MISDLSVSNLYTFEVLTALMDSDSKFDLVDTLDSKV